MKKPSEYFNRPVIGKIKTKELKCTWIRDGKEEEQVCPSEEMEVIAKTTMGTAQSNVYVCDSWYKEGQEPLAIAESMVECFTPYPVLVKS